jgi:GntR family transcriptional regulator, transcriptional repressor for pyruvate dehydrogenase complex
MPPFKKVNLPVRMPEAIVRQIEDKILLGKLKPGQMLLPESELMKQFGVGRNTVREALRILETSGLIKVRQGSRGGPVITELSNEFVSDFLIKAIRLGGVAADHLSQFRIALEPSIAEMLAGQEEIDPNLLSQLDQNVVRARALFEKGEVTAYANMEFHVLLAVATGNPMFIILLKTLEANFNLVMTTNFNSAMPLGNENQLRTIRHHEKILEAIKKRDPVGARQWMQEHLVHMAELFADERMQVASPTGRRPTKMDRQEKSEASDNRRRTR